MPFFTMKSPPIARRNIYIKPARVPQVRSPHGQVFVRGVEIPILEPGIPKQLELRDRNRLDRLQNPRDDLVRIGFRVRTAIFQIALIAIADEVDRQAD